MLLRLKKRLQTLLRPSAESWRDEVPRPILRALPGEHPICTVDLGAHDGDFTHALSLHYQISRGLLVEALPHKAEKLRARFAAPRYTVAECAVTDRAGTVDFEMNEAEETSSLLTIRRDLPELANVKLAHTTKLQVQAKTLDAIVAEANLPAIDLLKIDVQGAEAQVIAGASATLARTRLAWIEVSFKPLYEESATFFDVYAQLDRAGFGLLEVTSAFRAPNREMLQADGLFFRR